MKGNFCEGYEQKYDKNHIKKNMFLMMSTDFNLSTVNTFFINFRRAKLWVSSTYPNFLNLKRLYKKKSAVTENLSPTPKSPPLMIRTSYTKQLYGKERQDSTKW